MKILAINGSPHKNGTTNAAIEIVLNVLKEKGYETQTIHIGNDSNHTCIGCFRCKETKPARCVFTEDRVNEVLEYAQQADGIILGTPVHFSGVAGGMKSFLDRFIFLGADGILNGKVGLSLATLRRAGGVETIDQLNHYFEYAGMPVASSCYWKVIYGMNPEEIQQDQEGVHVLQTGARNMIWMMESFQKAGLAPPERSEKIWTNFIR